MSRFKMKDGISLPFLLGFIPWIFLSSIVYGVEHKPLFIESAISLPPGTLEAKLGIEFLRDQSFPFSTPSNPLSRNLWKIPAIGLALGLDKRTELQFDYELLYLDEEESGSGEKFGSGDLKIFTKIQILRYNLTYPALGLKVGVKLPNANDEARLGTNETDFFSSLLVTESYQGVTFHGNVGLAILQNPNQNTEQDDLLLLGFAAVFPITDIIHFIMEVEGQMLSRKNNNLSSMQVGLQFEIGNMQWDLGGKLRLTDQAADWSMLGRLIWRVKLWWK